MSYKDSDIAIRVENVSKAYRMYPKPSSRLTDAVAERGRRLLGIGQREEVQQFLALQDVSFEVARGESFGVIGRNGSGKSTLLQLITGVLGPSTGTIETRGRIAALLELGSGFNPEFSGRENVYLNGMLLGLTRAEVESRFDKIAAFADIGDHLDQPIKTYSSGMLVRLAFAVQVQIDPDILIIDEALAVGDALFQKRCFGKINQLVDDGVTILFVSHDQEIVRTLTRRSLLLHQGKMISLGNSSETLLAYRRLINEEESKYFASLSERNLTLAGVVPPDQVSEELMNQDVAAVETSATIVDIDPSSEAPGATQHVDGQEVVSDVVLATDDAVEELVEAPHNNIAKDVDSSVESDDSMGEKLGLDTASASFGTGHALVTSVRLFDAMNEPNSVFYPGEKVKILVEGVVNIPISNLNISLRIRNREGLKLYSWGTLNQDMARLARLSNDGIFWEREFAQGETFSVWFEFNCALGPNFYEVQAAVSHEATPDYDNQTIFHWQDGAAYFQVFMDKNSYYFGGQFDLKMASRW